jgi:hypothetical protein
MWASFRRHAVDHQDINSAFEFANRERALDSLQYCAAGFCCAPTRCQPIDHTSAIRLRAVLRTSMNKTRFIFSL